MKNQIEELEAAIERNEHVLAQMRTLLADLKQSEVYFAELQDLPCRPASAFAQPHQFESHETIGGA